MKIAEIVDLHVHLREDRLLKEVLHASTKNRSYIIAMPNLMQPLTDSKKMIDYFDKVDSLNPNKDCKILRTLYYTNNLKPAEIKKAKDNNLFAIKLYPSNMTTHSSYGVTLEELQHPPQVFFDNLHMMNQLGIPLLIHAEMPGSNCLESEVHFIPVINRILQYVPTLKISVEHITDERMIMFILKKSIEKYNIIGTITLHHLLLTIDDVVGSPMNYCRPVAKQQMDRSNLLKAINFNCFMLGSDSAPHEIESKTKYHGCAAGCYTAPYLIPHLYETLENNDLESFFYDFATARACEFHNLTEKHKYLELEKTEPYKICGEYNQFDLGKNLTWRVNVLSK